MLGVTAPKTLLDASDVNPRGFWESMPLIAEGERLLAAAGSFWHDWRRLDPGWFDSSAADECRRSIKAALRAEYGDAPFIFIKEPRICRFAPIYLSVLEHLKIAPIAFLPVRNPLEVAHSLKRRDGFTISRSLLVWLRHVLDAEHFTRTIPRCVCLYDDLMSDWRRELERAAASTGVVWPVDLDKAGAAVDDFLTADLHRERVSWQDAKESSEVTTLVRETFEVLRSIAREGEATEYRGTLDRLRAKLDEGCELFGPAIAAEEMAAQQARAELVRQAADTERKLAEIRTQYDQNQRAELAAQAAEKQHLLERTDGIEAEATALRTSLAQETIEKQQLIDAQSRAARENAGLREAIEQNLQEKQALSEVASTAIEDCKALREALVERNKEEQRLTGLISQAETESRNLRQSMVQETKEKELLADRVDLQSGEIEKLTEMVEHLRPAVTQREWAVSRLTAETERLRSIVAQMQKEVYTQLALRDAMKNSTSWRITAPLRRFKKVFTQ